MRTATLLPLIVLGLAGCVHVDRPPAQSSTVVTPAPAQPTYTTPPSTSTTVVRP